MRIYKYENAVVHITNPTDKHLIKIRKATEIFLKQVVKGKKQSENRGYN